MIRNLSCLEAGSQASAALVRRCVRLLLGGVIGVVILRGPAWMLLFCFVGIAIGTDEPVSGISDVNPV